MLGKICLVKNGPFKNTEGFAKGGWGLARDGLAAAYSDTISELLETKSGL